MRLPLHFLSFFLSALPLTTFSPGKFLPRLTDLQMLRWDSWAHTRTPDWMPGEWALLFFLRGQNIWELITVTLLSHTPAAPLTGHHGGNTDKLIPNPQNTFTKDYQIPCAPLLSVWKVGRKGEKEKKKSAGPPPLCGQSTFKIAPPESGDQQLCRREAKGRGAAPPAAQGVWRSWSDPQMLGRESRHRPSFVT